MNEVKLEGTLASDATYRHTPGGDLLISMDVRTPLENGTEAGVPVLWFVPSDLPAPSLAPFYENAVVQVEGIVRRRFSAQTGRIVSVTEVLTTNVKRIYA